MYRQTKLTPEEAKSTTTTPLHDSGRRTPLALSLYIEERRKGCIAAGIPIPKATGEFERREAIIWNTFDSATKQFYHTRAEALKKASKKSRASIEVAKSQGCEESKAVSTTAKLKRPPTAFFIFLSEQKKAQDAGQISRAEGRGGFAKHASIAWNNLDSAMKQAYCLKAEKLKKEFQARRPKSEASEDASTPAIPKVKKTPSAFFLFLSDRRNELKAAGQAFPQGNREFVKEQSIAWNNLDSATKEPYFTKAEELKKATWTSSSEASLDRNYPRSEPVSAASKYSKLDVN